MAAMGIQDRANATTTAVTMPPPAISAPIDVERPVSNEPRATKTMNAPTVTASPRWLETRCHPLAHTDRRSCPIRRLSVGRPGHLSGPPGGDGRDPGVAQGVGEVAPVPRRG